MAREKIMKLIESYTKFDGTGMDISELITTINSTTNDPNKISESLIMLFSIIDTNHKKNKELIIELLMIQLSITTDIERYHKADKANSNQSINKEDVKKKTDSKKDITNSFVTAITEAIKMRPGLSIIFLFVISISFMYFAFFYIDSKSADKAAQSVEKITQITTKGSKK